MQHNTNEITVVKADALLRSITTAYVDYPDQTFAMERLKSWNERLIPAYAGAVESILIDITENTDEYLESLEEGSGLDAQVLFSSYKEMVETIIGVIKATHGRAADPTRGLLSDYTLRNEIGYYLSYLYYDIHDVIADIAQEEKFVPLNPLIIQDLQTMIFRYELPNELLVNLHALFSVVISEWLEIAKLRADRTVRHLPITQPTRKEIVFVNNYVESILELIESGFFPELPMIVVPLT